MYVRRNSFLRNPVSFTQRIFKCFKWFYFQTAVISQQIINNISNAVLMKLWLPQITSFTYITDINLCREIIAVYSRNQAKIINGLCRQNAKCFDVIVIFKYGYHWMLKAYQNSRHRVLIRNLQQLGYFGTCLFIYLFIYYLTKCQKRK